jgi:hypothetical protein
MKYKRIAFLSALCLFIGIASLAPAQAFLDVEGGTAFTGYNDLAIPADTGPRISLKTDIASNPALSMRLRLGYTFGSRHTVSFLIAPLSVYGSSLLDREITYQGKTFAKGTWVSSIYRFDSYRFTYRYSFIDSDTLGVAAGLTGKIRSADIAIMSDSGYAHRSDLGVVPLINFAIRWNFTEPFSVLLDADALASPYGRAEDVLLALQYDSSDKVSWRLGYRLLEGGAAGGGNVYTFALLNYVMAGVHVTF